MGVCPNCGSWVDEGDICMSCGGSGSYGYDYDEDDREEDTKPIVSIADRLGQEAWDLYNDFEDEEALIKINEALSHNKNHPNNWNRKGIILEALKRYSESEECFSKSLSLSKSDVVSNNRAKMLYKWALQEYEESGKSKNPLLKLENSKRIITKAINAIPKDNTKENINKYTDLRDKVISIIDMKRSCL